MSIEVYIAADGRDTHRGTQKRPFATLHRARCPAGPAGSTIWISGDDYTLTESLSLGTRDGGRSESPLT